MVLQAPSAAHSGYSTERIMHRVLLATIPGALALTWHFGWGSLINVLLCSLCALACEALVLRLRCRPVGFYLRDCSALVTAVFLGLALPPLAPWWIVVVGCVFSIVIAKQLYGGLGYNPCNPAMVGYAALLLCFPMQMSRWLVPHSLLPEDIHQPGLWESLNLVFGAADWIDGMTGATPLDVLKQQTGMMIEQVYASQPVFQQAGWAGVGWEWVNLGFLAGGLWLLRMRVFSWHAPLAMLATLSLTALVYWDSGSSESFGSPVFHLFSGASMMGAFFILTDPVSSATSIKGKLVYGAMIGALVFVIRSWGEYPDAIAFAVLLANFAAPTIDRYSLPRSYGHARRGTKTSGDGDQ
ncbi:MAG: electron transport complex subunit RsxD [Porticoccaceae bacterium]|nr:electron transport complex subunit RsxD [Porticoccaceae bacterium]